MVNYKLVYFDVRGLAEPIRILFKYAGQEFEDVRLDADKYGEYKPKTKYGHVPALEMDDGRKLYEAQAIAVFLARQFGIAGKDEFEQAQLIEIGSFHRELSDEIKDYFCTFIPQIFTYKESEKEKLKMKAIDVLTVKLPIYEKMLDESGSGYLAKSGITWIDFFVGETITTLGNLLPEIIKKFPKLEEYRDRIYKHPKLQAHFDARKPSLL